jgi:alpha-L-fucosidase 2
MVWGGVEREQISLNEETIWAAAKTGATTLTSEYVQVNRRKRQLALDGKYDQIRKVTLANTEIPPGTTITKKTVEPVFSGDIYNPLADLYLHFGSSESPPRDYRRELNLNTAVSTVSYAIAGVTYKREAFTSFPDQVIVVRITADQPGKVSFSSRMHRRENTNGDEYRWHPSVEPRFLSKMPLPKQPAVTVLTPGHFSFNGATAPAAIHFSAHVKLVAKNGEVTALPAGFRVKDADEALLYITAETDFKGEDPYRRAAEQLRKLSGFTYEQLLRRHLNDYQALFNRVDFAVDKGSAAQLPTDKRVLAFQRGVIDARLQGAPRDNDLFRLLFNFGRYLMIASSREGTLPPALQGIWNDSLLPPWKGHHTTDINVQMNYWAADVANYPEFHRVLLDFLMPHLARVKPVAEICYGTRGVVFSGMSQWGLRAAPSGDWTSFPGWMGQHYWEHYLHTQDREYLRNVAYPFMKEVALFHLDNLIEYPGRNYLVHGLPEYSPENSFFYRDNGVRLQGQASLGTTMSRAIIGELFANTAQAAALLGVDDSLAADLQRARFRLSPYQVGRYGQLQEWLEDFEEESPGHRHLSHLYPVYPGYEITRSSNPVLFAAAKKSLERRLENHMLLTGWANAWALCLAARFGDQKMTSELLEQFASRFLLSNLFSTHPRQGGNTACFQIDGNFGFVAGVAELLMQSHEDGIHLLPAKPENWRTGHIKGLRARGAFLVDIHWKNGVLLKAAVKSTAGGRCKVRHGGRAIEFDTVANTTYALDASLKLSGEQQETRANPMRPKP